MVNARKLSLFLFLGYPALIAYFVPVIIYTISNAGSSDPNLLRDMIFLFAPQYLTIILFLLFHLFVSLPLKPWTVLVLQGISVLFSFFAGSSLIPVGIFTDGFQLQNQESDSLVLGLVILIVFQFYGYVSWPLVVMQQLQVDSHNESNFRQTRSDALSFIFVIAAVFGLDGLILYGASATANSVEFCKIAQFIPVLLFPVIIVMEGLLMLFKKRWMGIILFPVNFLFSLFLGYSIYLLSYTFGFYYKIPLASRDKLINSLSFKLFVFQLTGSLILLVSLCFMNFVWIKMFWYPLTINVAERRRGSSAINNEDEPLIPTSSGYYAIDD